MSGCGGFPFSGDRFVRPGRQYPPGTIRPPDQHNIPGIATLTGFGTGSGAGITQVSGISDGMRGTVAIRVGTGPAASGTLSLSFPVAAATYWTAAEWASLVTTQGNPLSVAWTATRSLTPGETLFLAYEATPDD